MLFSRQEHIRREERTEAGHKSLLLLDMLRKELGEKKGRKNKRKESDRERDRKKDRQRDNVNRQKERQLKTDRGIEA